MLSRELQKAVAPRARTLNVLWGAFLAATVFYVGVAMFAIGDAEPTAGATEPAVDPWILTAVLAMAAAVAAAGSFLVPRLLLPAQGKPRLKIDGSRQKATAAETAAAAHLPESERALLGLLPAYQVTMVVTWALRESVAVFGVIAAVVTRQPASVVPFAVAAFALLALARPRAAGYLESRQGHF
ncbi:MAG: hypothetical protein IPK64_16500 [bacterium]|nr:hypothetical protein [bacterium]